VRLLERPRGVQPIFLNVSWHHFVAYAPTVFTRSGFPQIRLGRATSTNFVMISAHEYTEAAHQAIASLHIPGLAIVDMEKLPKPDRQTRHQ
jgi:hypothetical protein